MRRSRFPKKTVLVVAGLTGIMSLAIKEAGTDARLPSAGNNVRGTQAETIPQPALPQKVVPAVMPVRENVVKPNVYTLSQTRIPDIQQIEPVSQTSAVVIRSKTNPEVAALLPGQILMLEPSDRIPGGLLVRIEEKTATAGDQIVLLTSRAALTDAFEHLDVKITAEDIPFDQAKFVPANPFLQPAAPAVQAASLKVPRKPSSAVLRQVAYTRPAAVFRTASPARQRDYSPFLVKRVASPLQPYFNIDMAQKQIKFGNTVSFAVKQTMTAGESMYTPVAACAGTTTPCVEARFPLSMALSQINMTSPGSLLIDHGQLLKYEIGFKSRFDSKVAASLTTYNSGKQPLSLNLADIARTLSVMNISTGKSVASTADVGLFRLKGVTTSSDKVLLGTLIWNSATAAAGVMKGGSAVTVPVAGAPASVPAAALGTLTPEVQLGKRQVPVIPSLAVTLFITSKGEISGMVEGSYATPALNINASMKMSGTTITTPLVPALNKPVSWAGSITAASGDYGMLTVMETGKASLTSTVGTDVGLSVFNITPVNWSSEAGTVQSLAGSFRLRNSFGGIEGCTQNARITAGFRSYVQLVTGLTSKPLVINGLTIVPQLSLVDLNQTWSIFPGDAYTSNNWLNLLPILNLGIQCKSGGGLLL